MSLLPLALMQSATTCLHTPQHHVQPVICTKDTPGLQGVFETFFVIYYWVYIMRIRHGSLVTTITAVREGILGGLSGAHIMGGYDVGPQGNYDSAAPSSIFKVRLRLRLWASHFSSGRSL